MSYRRRVVLVASGGSLSEPAILGRSPTCRSGQLKIWRGSEGFDDSREGLIIKTSPTPTAGVKVEVISCSERGDDEEDLFMESQDGALEDEYSSLGGTTSRNSPILPSVQDTVIEKVLATDTLPRAREESVIATEEQFKSTTHISTEVTVYFLDSADIVTREKTYHACDTVRKLFLPAACGKIVDITNGKAALAATVGNEEIRLMYGDEDDFKVLNRVITEEVDRSMDGKLQMCIKAM